MKFKIYILFILNSIRHLKKKKKKKKKRILYNIYVYMTLIYINL